MIYAYNERTENIEEVKVGDIIARFGPYKGVGKVLSMERIFSNGIHIDYLITLELLGTKEIIYLERFNLKRLNPNFFLSSEYNYYKNYDGWVKEGFLVKINKDIVTLQNLKVGETVFSHQPLLNYTGTILDKNIHEVINPGERNSIIMIKIKRNDLPVVWACLILENGIIATAANKWDKKTFLYYKNNQEKIDDIKNYSIFNL